MNMNAGRQRCYERILVFVLILGVLATVAGAFRAANQRQANSVALHTLVTSSSDMTPQAVNKLLGEVASTLSQTQKSTWLARMGIVLMGLSMIPLAIRAGSATLNARNGLPVRYGMMLLVLVAVGVIIWGGLMTRQASRDLAGVQFKYEKDTQGRYVMQINCEPSRLVQLCEVNRKGLYRTGFGALFAGVMFIGWWKVARKGAADE
jgi:hypothetical protein